MIEVIILDEIGEKTVEFIDMRHTIPFLAAIENLEPASISILAIVDTDSDYELVKKGV